MALASLASLEQQYGVSDHLNTRIETHRLYTKGPELESAIDSALSLTGNESLLDIGTGPANFPARLTGSGHSGTIVGLDLHSAPTHSVPFVRAGATQLPFADATFEVVTARHMLYHVDDIPAAIAEAHRVLRPDGLFLVATNAADNLATFWSVVDTAARAYPPLKSLSLNRGAAAFSDHHASQLIRRSFSEPQLTRIESRLDFPSPWTVHRYFLSFLPGRPDIEPAAALAAFTNALDLVFPTHPTPALWSVAKAVVLITARKS